MDPEGVYLKHARINVSAFMTFPDATLDDTTVDLVENAKYMQIWNRSGCYKKNLMESLLVASEFKTEDN